MTSELLLRDATVTYLDGRLARQEIAPHTRRNYAEAFRIFLDFVGRHKRVATIEHRCIERWIESMSGLARTTVRMRVNTLRPFFRWAIQNGHTRRDPMRDIRAPRLPRTVPLALHAEQVTAALQGCRDDRARLAILLMAQEGLRRAEVAKLSVGTSTPSSAS
jgi:integrase/recombinase XerC